MSAIDLLGYTASLAVFATFWMNTMVPLRVLALGSNVLFVAYGYLGGVYPVLILHLALLPVNLVRLIQIRQLVRGIRLASGTISIHGLLPYMRRRRAPAGETLFRKGDPADRLYYIAAGSVRIVELNLVRGGGELIGEIGVFSPDQKRMATVVCLTDCELHELSDKKARELYFQDPAFGYAVLRLITARLLDDYQEAVRSE